MSTMSYPQLPKLAEMLARLVQGEHLDWSTMSFSDVWRKVLFYDRSTGKTLEFQKIGNGWSYPKHSHTCVQIEFLVTGHVRLESGKIIAPGTITYIPAFQMHAGFEALEDVVTLNYFASVPVYLFPDLEPMVDCGGIQAMDRVAKVQESVG